MNTVLGDFLADSETLLAARLERVALDDISRHQPNLDHALVVLPVLSDQHRLLGENTRHRALP